MGLDLSKPFVISLFFFIGLGIITKNFWTGLVGVIGFAILTILWRYLTR